MRVWSYQSLDAFETLQKDGVLRARLEHADPYFWPSYGVMREMMVEHVGPPPTPETYPLWAWVKRRNGVRAQDRKPRYRKPGHVRLVLEVPKKQMLITDFHAWENSGLHHLPLCEWDSEEDIRLNRVIDHMKHDDPTRLDIVKPTWQRLHDLEWCVKHFHGEPCRREQWLQATLWEIRLCDVLEVELLDHAHETWEAYTIDLCYQNRLRNLNRVLASAASDKVKGV